MSTIMDNKKDQAERDLYFKNGRMYFTKDLERKIFFFLTIVMLGLGVIYKADLF